MSLIRNRQSDVKRHTSSLKRKHIHVELTRSVVGPDANVAFRDGHANTESDAAGLARRFAENVFPAVVHADAVDKGPSALLPKPRT